MNNEYTTYPRQFDSYKWYKPIFVFLLTLLFTAIFSVIVATLSMICVVLEGGSIQSFLEQTQGGYDTMTIATASGALILAGSLSVIIPALALSALIVRDRPFSSYSSSRGGWNWGIFLKILVLAFIIFSIPTVISELITAPKSPSQFTLAGFIIITLLGPIQCAAEEYLFRGFIMQTFGSWIKIPAAAIIIQAVLFASLHPYNITGVIEILAMGITFGVVTYITKGIEASSAIHIVNNMTGFYLVGFGVGTFGSEQSVKSLIFTILYCFIYIFVIKYIDKKYHWFDGVNEEVEEQK